MWNRVAALVLKEFLALLKDPRSRTVIIVPPLLQLLVFGYAATFDLNDIPYAVYNEDPGQPSRDLLARFASSDNFRLVETVARESDIGPLVDRRRVLLVLHVRRTFSRDLYRGGSGELQVLLDGRNSNTALVALGYVQIVVNGFNTEWAAAHGQREPPAHLVTRAWFNPNLESRWFIVPGIAALLTLVVTLLVTALSVARERENGTFDQLLVAPYRPWEILIGKSVPGFVIGLGEASVIILAAVFWFQVPLVGSLVALYGGLVVFLFCVIGVGLMVSSLAVTQQQGLLGAFLFLVPAIILSGFATPIADMPPAVQRLTLINPMRYIVEIVRRVFLEGATVSDLSGQLWPMAVIGVVTLTAATWLFRHRMQ